MVRLKRAALFLLAALCVYCSIRCGGLALLYSGLSGGRMTVKSTVNALSTESSPIPEAEPTPSPAPAAVPTVMETTISGALLNNATDYSVDCEAILSAGWGHALAEGAPQILIIHTHSSEAYTPAGLDIYSPSGSFRTLDDSMSVIRIGDELAAVLEDAGLSVLHDREFYDYPSYNGSYSRSGEAVSRYLSENPTIKIVFDIHRDALGTDETVYKTVADVEGVCSSQLMLFVGTDESGLEHPYWQDNLALALMLQSAASDKYPTLMRPVQLVSSRYNQHLTRGSMIIEVGSSGNTLLEALAAIRLFGAAIAPALLGLVE